MLTGPDRLSEKGKPMTVSALNFKPYDRGAMRGFFDLRYHGLTIKGCRLMVGNNGLWIALPQKDAEQDGERKFFDQMYLTAPEMDHVRRMVVSDLEAQGHIGRPNNGTQKRQGSRNNQQPSQCQGGHRSPEGEDLSEYYPQGEDDGDIPF